MTKPIRRTLGFVACLFAIVQTARAAAAPAATPDEPPTIPIGVDAYRQWDQWPLQRIGCRAYMKSTYDRAGGNEGADASHFLYQLADDQNVALDEEGPAGVLYFVRTNHWHGSPWHYVIDGTDTIVTESSTKDPLHPVKNSTFDPPFAFPKPLAFTWSDTRGADLSWVPIEFQKSLRLAYSRTHYGTGYYIFHRFVPGAQLSRPIKSWTGQPPATDVLQLLDRAGESVADLKLWEQRNHGSVGAHETVRALRINQGAILRQLQFRFPQTSAHAAERVRLRITWDDRSSPSVDAPLALFYGAGTFYNRDHRQFLVKAFPFSVEFVADGDTAKPSIVLTCNFPMPFQKSATLELVGADDAAVEEINWIARYETLKQPLNRLAYFHATYRDFPKPERGRDLELLDTRNLEESGQGQGQGQGGWTGSFIGTSFIFSHNAVLTTLEGDPRFYFDDSKTPQAQGTGTEEWGGGGDYWGGQNMTLPFAGHPTGAKSAKEAKNDDDKIESAYRVLLADLFPFGRNARITLEHGGTNESAEHYETVCYWYGLPGQSLVQTDELKIGDAESEKSHAYASPQASEPYKIESRYEWSVDHLKDGTEVFPAHTETARSTTGSSEFTLKLDPENWGVMLRRTLDYQFPNQRAEVAIETKEGWEPTGIWYTAGSNTCVYSNPKDELGPTQHEIKTSNRRFRDDEFLLPRDLTRGHDSIKVRVTFTPVNTPLFPGHPLAPLAWTEIRYRANCFVMPQPPP